MNEEYLLSKMYSSGFASFIALTQKAVDFCNKYPHAQVKLYESVEMKQAIQASTRTISMVLPNGGSQHYINQFDFFLIQNF
jgi:hypothetical protein